MSAQPDLPGRQPRNPIEATEDDIADHVAKLAFDSTRWHDPDVKPRLSLAGTQGKFSLAHVEGRWFWPTYELPSTHIIKPPSNQLHGIERYEHAALELAKRADVPTSGSNIMDFRGQRAFVTQRWDRAGTTRLHAEDLNQALGQPVGRKYDAMAPQIAQLLSQYGEQWAFLKQLAFNAALGNGDAHSKNYSVLLAGNQVAMSPLYDAIPAILYPQFSSAFFMQIGKAKHPAELTEPNWRVFAAKCGMNADQVCEVVFPIMNSVAEGYEETFAMIAPDPFRRRKIAKHVQVLRRAIPNDALAVNSAPPISSETSSTSAGSRQATESPTPGRCNRIDP